MQRFFLSACFLSIRDIFLLDESVTILLVWKMQEKIWLKCTGNTGHIMEFERNLYEYSNSFRHHTSGICTTGSEYLRYGLSHHWIKSAIPHRTLKNIQLTTSHRGRLIFPTTLSRLWLFQLTTSHRGRRQLTIDQVLHPHISTHYLTQR